MTIREKKKRPDLSVGRKELKLKKSEKTLIGVVLSAILTLWVALPIALKLGWGVPVMTTLDVVAAITLAVPVILAVVGLVVLATGDNY